MCFDVKKIQESNNYREELYRAIDASSFRLSNALNRFNDNKAVKPINRHDLEAFPLMAWIEINDSIQVRKRKNRFNTYLNFDTKMLKGAEFGEHFHEDIIESAEVIVGEMLDTSDGTIYKEGDVAHYEKGEKHTPVATKDTILNVLFK